jgi:hypothetical protein
MKSVDMFFPIGKKLPEERISFSDRLPKGATLSPHILTFRKNSKNEFVQSNTFVSPVSPLSPFQKKRIPEGEQDIPLEIQMEKTKRVLGMSNDFSNFQNLKKSPSSSFFRNLRSMFSLGLFLLGSLLVVSASASAFYTAQDIKQTAKNSLETTLLDGFNAMEQKDFQRAQQIFGNASKNLSSTDFFFRFTAHLSKQNSFLMQSMV